MSNDDIDVLINRYLHVLEEYTTLRTQLNALQLSVHLNISRANFSSDRGIRYGQDYYDERMQASALLLTCNSTTRRFALTHEESNSDKKDERLQSVENTNEIDESKSIDENQNHEQTATDDKDKADPVSLTNSNPLRWFGILTPQSLRSAQRDAKRMVREIIPQLASKDAELKELEIEIRRARKKFAKSSAIKGIELDRKMRVDMKG